MFSIGTACAANNSPLEEQWNITFHEDEDDHITSIITSVSGGYIVSGTLGYSVSSANGDGFLYEVGSDGNIVWSTYFGGDQDDYFTAVVEDGEGDYLALGNTASTGSGKRDALMVKVDSNGNEVWDRTFYEDSSIISSAQKTSDGNLILAGMRAPLITAGGNLMGLLIKVDPEGNELWSKTFGPGWIRKYDYFNTVQETPEGEFIMAGLTTSFSSSNMEDGWLVKADSEGNELWNKSFGDVDLDMLNSVTSCSDGGYITVGKSKPYGQSLFNAWAVKTDKDGNLLWEKRYFEGSESFSNSIIEVPDGNYVIVGSVGNIHEGSVKASFGVDNYQGFLMKIDENGDEVWSYIYEGYSDSAFNTVIESNGNYVAGGSMIPDGTDSSDSLLIVFNDPELQKYESTEDEVTEESSSPTTEEQSPLSFTVTLVSIGLSFIALKRRL
ncbi:hypothetical protein RE474_07590 [Methanolobus sediminis]|uniref:Uncharacterized protein n=1 Tax=Methanolobus sediminis TaxID=3072978 RepID=A0AA51YHZ4_9EURY|nr:hypothetical protein [Methanolobus sediminis]WMW23965.1 hypothetical protein RE474_07590 [Methanolobus sediminis]